MLRNRVLRLDRSFFLNPRLFIGGLLYLFHRQKNIRAYAFSQAMLYIAIKCGFFPEIYLKPHLKIRHDEDFLDIGAYLGVYAMIFSNKCRHVFAWEPDPKSFRLLKANTLKLRNVTCYSEALGEKEGVCAFFALDDEEGHGSLLYKYPKARAIDVTVKPLDSYDFQDRIGLIKIDAEGYEASIIAGGLETIGKHKPRLIVEIHRPHDEHEREIRKLLPHYKWERILAKDLPNFHLVGSCASPKNA